MAGLKNPVHPENPVILSKKLARPLQLDPFSPAIVPPSRLQPNIKPIKNTREVDVRPFEPGEIDVGPLKSFTGREIAEHFRFHCDVIAGLTGLRMALVEIGKRSEDALSPANDIRFVSALAGGPSDLVGFVILLLAVLANKFLAGVGNQLAFISGAEGAGLHVSRIIGALRDRHRP